MVPLRSPVLCALTALLATWVLAVAFGREARGEEALVLDNGAILRGSVVREDARTVVFQLSGVGADSRVSVAKTRILQRFVTVDPKAAARVAPPVDPTSVDPAVSEAPGAVVLAAVPTPNPTHAQPAKDLPEEEPAAKEENFFERTSRRALMAFPRDPGARAFVACLGIVVLLCLVGLGGRMADVEGLSLGRSTTLALLLGGLVLLNVLWADTLLRADRAPVLVPLQLLAWMGCAAGILRCGFARAFTLLGFVIFAGALVSFATAVVLVSV